MKTINKEKKEEMKKLGLPVKTVKFIDKGSMRIHFYVSFNKKTDESNLYDLNDFANILNNAGFKHTYDKREFTKSSFNGGNGFYLLND